MPANAKDVARQAAAYPRPLVRFVVSVLLILHVVAVFVGPWSMPPTGSLLATWAAEKLQPYLQAASLDNGYRFFAPDPGPSHLIRFELLMPDGKELKGFFPDRKRHSPRLLYHRYFMLSEFMNTIFPDPDSKPSPLAEAYLHSYARHLAHRYGARRVTLYLRRHELPSMADVRRGMKLDDPRLYEEKRVGTFEGSDL